MRQLPFFMRHNFCNEPEKVCSHRAKCLAYSALKWGLIKESFGNQKENVTSIVTTRRFTKPQIFGYEYLIIHHRHCCKCSFFLC